MFLAMSDMPASPASGAGPAADPKPLRLRLGCQMTYWFPQETPLIALVNVHYSRADDLIVPDPIATFPKVPVVSYRDLFGNWCVRMTAPAGEFTIGTDCLIRDSGQPDRFDETAEQHAIEDLPYDALTYLLPSRYCDSDVLMADALTLFGQTPPDGRRVQAIVDYVHNHLVFSYPNARPTRTAAEAHHERSGVCRDFTHLAIAFCRAMNIPAMYCSGYISDVNMPGPDYPAQDFCAWMRVYLGGQWRDYDPRNNKPMTGRVLCTTGRDAADTPLIHSFGWHALNSFKVWADPVNAGTPAMLQAPDVTLAGRHMNAGRGVQPRLPGEVDAAHVRAKHPRNQPHQARLAGPGTAKQSRYPSIAREFRGEAESSKGMVHMDRYPRRHLRFASRLREASHSEAARATSDSNTDTAQRRSTSASPEAVWVAV